MADGGPYWHTSARGNAAPVGVTVSPGHPAADNLRVTQQREGRRRPRRRGSPAPASRWRRAIAAVSSATGPSEVPAVTTATVKSPAAAGRQVSSRARSSCSAPGTSTAAAATTRSTRVTSTRARAALEQGQDDPLDLLGKLSGTVDHLGQALALLPIEIKRRET